jgi:hypothetical protein
LFAPFANRQASQSRRTKSALTTALASLDTDSLVSGLLNALGSHDALTVAA